MAGIILAAPGLIDLGQKIYRMMENDKKLKTLAGELRLFTLEEKQAQLRVDFELAHGVLKDQSIDESDKRRLVQIHDKAMERLEHIRDLTEFILSSSAFVHVRKRALVYQEIKDELSAITDSFSEFHQMVMSLHLTKESESSLFLEDHDFVLLGEDRDWTILSSTAFLARGRGVQALPGGTSKVGTFCLECKPYVSETRGSAKKDLRVLSTKLAATKQLGGVLPLVGFRDNPSRSQLQLVFRGLSDSSSVKTMATTYELEPKPSLNLRAKFCQQLAEAVLQTHALGLVHKNIRPENILLVRTKAENGVADPVPKVVLSGWQYARKVDGSNTRLVGESMWQKAIYQHPERQSDHVDAEYCMGHDVYSLGVCMLEVITWIPLVYATAPGRKAISQEYRASFEDVHQTLYHSAPAQPALDVYELADDPELIQKALVEINHRLVPTIAGEKMENIINDCLTCLDPTESFKEFRVSEERDRKEIALGFTDTVLKSIRSIVQAI